MFDIGFWELSIIGVVALIVIGPERLPSVARTAGLWVGRMRSFVSTVKADVDKQLKADELQNVLKEQADSSGIHDIIEETREAVNGIEKEAISAAEVLDEPPQDYLVKSEDNSRYDSADDYDDDYYDDDDDSDDVEAVTEADTDTEAETEVEPDPESEKSEQQDNVDKA